MKVQKSGKGFYARVGDFFGPQAETPQAAIKGLDKELENYHPLNHGYIFCKNGTLLHIFQQPSAGWVYRIIPMTGYVGQGRAGGETYQEAYAKATKHAEEFGGVVS